MINSPSGRESEASLLATEEFSKPGHLGIPKYNNLILYFMKGMFAEAKQEEPWFQQLQQEHPNLAADLSNGIADLQINSMEDLKPFEANLYEAYKIMREYGASDEELFG